jgi:hypothetical protein
MPIAWFDNRSSVEAVLHSLAPLDASVVKALETTTTVAGLCRPCGRPMDLTLQPKLPDVWRNYSEDFVCTCGLNGRMRNALVAIEEVRQVKHPVTTVILERVTPFFSRVQSDDPNIVGCEYLGDNFIGGRQYEHHGVLVRHENMLDLSFADGEIDLLLHFDVLEHVPDRMIALSEARRVIASGGSMVFTLPFYPGLDRHVIRAKPTKNGIVHILPPAYHGNPVSEHGALVYFHPGWQLLEDLSQAGFDEVRIGLGYDVIGGVVSNGCPFPDGLAWPIVFWALKHGSLPEHQ